jgi:hypothetical protein
VQASKCRSTPGRYVDLETCRSHEILQSSEHKIVIVYQKYLGRHTKRELQNLRGRTQIDFHWFEATLH